MISKVISYISYNESPCETVGSDEDVLEETLVATDEPEITPKNIDLRPIGKTTNEYGSSSPSEASNEMYQYSKENPQISVNDVIIYQHQCKKIHMTISSAVDALNVDELPFSEIQLIPDTSSPSSGRRGLLHFLFPRRRKNEMIMTIPSSASNDEVDTIYNTSKIANENLNSSTKLVIAPMDHNCLSKIATGDHDSNNNFAKVPKEYFETSGLERLKVRCQKKKTAYMTVSAAIDALGTDDLPTCEIEIIPELDGDKLQSNQNAWFRLLNYNKRMLEMIMPAYNSPTRGFFDALSWIPMWQHKPQMLMNQKFPDAKLV